MSAVRVLQIPVGSSFKGDSVAWISLIKALVDAEENISTSWALQEENKEVAGIAAVWKSQASYKLWEDTPEAKKVGELIKSAASGHVYDELVVFSEDVIPALAAPVVELVSWIFPVSKLTAEHMRKVETGFSNFQKPLSQTEEIFGGLVGGWAQEYFLYEGVLSRRFTCFIGWKSVEAHYACKKTKPFLENSHWLRENDHSAVEMRHYAYARS